MDYIRESYKGFVFDEKFCQVFKNKPVTTIDDKNIIKLRSEKHITDTDMKIIKFLFSNRFATIDILFKLLKNEVKDLDDLSRDLSRLLKHRVINAFALMESSQIQSGVKMEVPFDAKLFYCLDIGGRLLVGHFHNADTTNWYTIENMRGVEKIGKDLVTNYFYLDLIDDCSFDKDSKNYFKLNPSFNLNKQRVSPSFEMKINLPDSSFRYYIGEIVRDFEFPSAFREHLSKLDSVWVTNAWKKYFYDVEVPPVIFFICEDDQKALEVARMVVGMTSITADVGFRLTTDERLKMGLGEKGCFLEYIPSTDSLVEKRITSFSSNKN